MTPKVVAPLLSLFSSTTTTAPAAATKMPPSNHNDKHRSLCVLPNNEELILRPFDSNRISDCMAMEEICLDVYGGTDYLPGIAKDLQTDPLSTFMVLSTTTSRKTETTNSSNSNNTTDTVDPTADSSILHDYDRPVAAANIRLLRAGSSIGWLEAVRTHPDFRGQGLATLLIQAMMKELVIQRQDNPTMITQFMTTTVKSNLAMRKVFDRLGMQQQTNRQIHILNPSQVKDLPGWTTAASTTAINNKLVPTFMQAWKLESLLSKEAIQKLSSPWKTVQSQSELEQVLEKLYKQIFPQEQSWVICLPGLYKLLEVRSNKSNHTLSPLLTDALESGRLVYLSRDNNVEAFFMFAKDYQIQSLRSKWVCSIVGTSTEAIEAAIAKASAVSKDLLDGEVAFCIVFETGTCPLDITTPGTFCAAIPLTPDPCVIYATPPTGDYVK